jgi:hypothetical protein
MPKLKLSNPFKKTDRGQPPQRGASPHDFGDNSAMQRAMGAAPLTDDHIKSFETLTTATAAGSIHKMKYHKDAVNKGETRHGFFKANADMEDPMSGMSARHEEEWKSIAAVRDDDRRARRQARDAGLPEPANTDISHLKMTKDEKHMAARAVTSSRVDKLLGTDVLTDERFATHGGVTGVTSMMAEGQAIRSDRRVKIGNGSLNEQTYLDVDARGPEFQRSMADLQVNDYLTGQVDRHSGNMFFDPKSGRVRGIDNDLAFGDLFNENFTSDDAQMAKHVKNLPTHIDAETAERILAIDPLDYFSMLEGVEDDPERLTGAEAVGSMDRLLALQEHVEKLLAKKDGADVDVDGTIVDEWNDETYDEQLGGEADSYLKRTVGEIEDAKANPSNSLKTKPVSRKKKGFKSLFSKKR